MTEETQPQEVAEMPAVEAPAVLSPEPVSASESEAIEPVAETESETPDSSIADKAADVAPAATTVNLEAMESARPAPGARLGAALGRLGGLFKGRGWLIPVLLAVALLVILSIPPISLWTRIAEGGGYTAMSADMPSVRHDDGLTVAVDPAAAKDFKVRLESVPLLDFVSERAPEAHRMAVAALPTTLTPRGPYFTLAARGKDASPVTLELDIPNESEPWETLDVYSWDGTAWQWLPFRLERDRFMLVANLETLPVSVMIMQSGPVQQQLFTELPEVAPPPADAQAVLTGFDVPGLTIGTLGQLVGDVSMLPVAAPDGPALALTVRNWVPDREPNRGLVQDMLAIQADRMTHVQTLLKTAQERGYVGVVLDYRGLTDDDRARYSEFVAELAAALHVEGLWLAVTVETPQQSADSWYTGGYDWRALGATADQVRVLMPVTPQAYIPGGLAEQMMAWGITQVNRYRLYPIFTTLSVAGETLKTMEESLPSATLQLAETITETLQPGQTLTFRLDPIITTETDAATGATKVFASGQEIWLGTPQWLRVRLDMPRRYHLGGVLLQGMLDEGNFPGLPHSLSDYQLQAPPVPYTLPNVVWRVTNPAGQVVETELPYGQADFTWVTPELTGSYTVTVQLLGVERGALQLEVGPGSEVAVEDPDTATTATTPPDPTTTPEPSTDLKAAFVADVTVPDNTRFEKSAAFTKTWRLRNAGNTPWPADTRLVFESGQQLGTINEVAVGEVAAGANADISVELNAPDADGAYQGVWRLMSGNQQISGGVVTVVIRVGEAQAAPPPPAAPVAGGSFELGGHIRDYGFPYTDQMRYSGMTWSKVQVHYGQDASGIIQASHARGFKIQLSALGSPSMVTQPGYEQQFATWVAGLAAAGADAIEVWNEPNIDREWQIGHISPQSYTNLLCASYRAIKAANSGTAVISAAPAPTGYFGGCSANGCDDQPWMEGLYAAGAANCMDFIGAHHNSGATAPSARSGHPAGGLHHSWYFLPQTELYYNIFRGTRKLFYTEMGYASQEGVPGFSDAFGWARGITNAQQAAWLAEAARLGANTGMVRCIIVWNIDFGRYGYDPQDGYAIIRPGGGCPACETLHAVLGSR